MLGRQMRGWMDACMDEQVGRWMNNGCTDEAGLMCCVLMGVCMHRWMDKGWLSGCVHGWVDRYMAE